MRILVISEGRHEEHALVRLVARVITGPAELSFMKVSDPQLHSTHGKGRGMWKKAMRCIEFAFRKGYEGVIVVIDQDNDLDRRQQFTAAQEDLRWNIRRALGIAIQTFDAWMLADEQALSNILGVRIQRQPDPERMSDAKARCRELLDASNYGMSQTEMYASLAEVLDLNALAQRCPDGFGALSRRIRAM